MTSHPCLRSLLIASLVSVGFLPLPGSDARAEGDKPHEPNSLADYAAHVPALRKEVEALRHRIEQLEKARPADAGKRHGGDPGERERLLAETHEIVAHFDGGKAHVWKEAHGKIRDLRLKVAASLMEMQEEYTRRARLDDAVAIRDAIAFIKYPGRSVLSDPGLLRAVGEASRILFFRVTGGNSGSVYGTDVYTSDSSLATAAVHAGVLKAGQAGIVKVTTIPSHPGYVSSVRNGITSSAWGSHPGFRVEALGDEDQDLNEGESVDSSVGKAPQPPHCASGPGNDAPKEIPHGDPFNPTMPCMPALPAALPGEVRERIGQFTATTSDIRRSATEQIRRLAREAVARLAPIQDAHTRAARLDEAISVRDMIRRLAESNERHSQ